MHSQSASAKKQWLGRAVCSLEPGHEQLNGGYRGAILVFATCADDVVTAVRLLYEECLENKLRVIGFDYLFNLARLEREPSEYEEQLIEKLGLYPVQFKNVHFHKHEA